MQSRNVRRASALALCATLAAPAAGQVTETVKVIGSQVAAGDESGQVAVWRDGAQLRCVVGATLHGGSDAGAASIHTWNGVTLQEEAWLSPPPGSQKYFGIAVAIEHDTVAVGSRGNAAGTDSGAVDMYAWDGTTWNQSEHLVAIDGAAGDRFGHTLALRNGRLAIGAIGDDDEGIDAGAVYIYSYVAPFGWLYDAKLTPVSLQAGDSFGDAVAFDPDGITLVTGASHDDDMGTDSGSVYVFRLTPTGWTEVSKHKASNGVGGDRFGWSVACGSGFFVVGALRRHIGGTADAGAAYVFEQVAGAWTQSAYLTVAGLPSSAELGASCAVQGDSAVVGAIRANQAGVSSGAVYRFAPLGGVWDLYEQLMPSDGAAGDLFGFRMAASTDSVLVGSARHDAAGTDAGAAYLYDLAPPPSVTARCTCGDSALAPCGNSDPLAGCVNALGRGGKLSAAGSASVAADDLVLTATQILPNQFGILFMGQLAAEAPFGDGLLCVGQSGSQPIFRFPPQATTAAALLVEGPGIVATSQGFGPAGQIAPGATWHFQGWYRDPVGPCGATFNLTNALEVGFQP